MSKFLLMAGNGSRARFFAGASALGKLEEVECMVNNAARQHERDLVSDRPGRNPDQMGVGRSAVSESHHKEHSIDEFANRISEFLTERHDAGDFDELTIVAAPSLLGRLRSVLSSPVRNAVVEELDKDLAFASPEDIQGQLTRIHR